VCLRQLRTLHNANMRSYIQAKFNSPASALWKIVWENLFMFEGPFHAIERTTGCVWPFVVSKSYSPTLQRVNTALVFFVFFTHEDSLSYFGDCEASRPTKRKLLVFWF
jgi:hypothetical protein